jgi:SOS-response transcriptional repressor LexA
MGLANRRGRRGDGSVQEVHDRLRQARIAAGYEKSVDAARAFGWNEVTYRAHENGTRGLTRTTISKYAKVFRVPVAWLLTGEGEGRTMDGTGGLQPTRQAKVEGIVAAGVWREAHLLDALAYEPVTAHPDPKYAHLPQFAVVVEGDSMNKTPAKDGVFVLCVRFDALGRDARDGEAVIVERRRAGQVETSIKRVHVTRRGIELRGESTSPKFNLPMILDHSDEDTEVAIVALCIGFIGGGF